MPRVGGSATLQNALAAPWGRKRRPIKGCGAEKPLRHAGGKSGAIAGVRGFGREVARCCFRRSAPFSSRGTPPLPRCGMGPGIGLTATQSGRRVARHQAVRDRRHLNDIAVTCSWRAGLTAARCGRIFCGREPPVQSGGRRANSRRCPRRVAIKIRNVVRRPDVRDTPERAALCRVAAIVRDARATEHSCEIVRLDASLCRALYGF